ncbi:hypothetical protein [Pedobacter agri]|uniref:hypothetical protein n=1 Tax=Pedobacter agri TaxID=454586 RepID=UPI00292D51A9|nr:hypothetical protein [Pedobacter agri]
MSWKLSRTVLRGEGGSNSADLLDPDLGQIAYYHYLLGKKQGRLAGFDFHVINLTAVEKSRRINVLRPDYIVTLADAGETADSVNVLRDHQHGLLKYL